MKMRMFWAAGITALALGVPACGGSSNGNPSGPAPPTEPGSATFASISSQIFSQRCISCHGGGAPEAGLNLTSGSAFNALVNVPSTQRSGAIRVIPGNADGSYLIQKLRGDPGIVGTRMPQGGPFLSDADINRIRQWINEGARNN